MYILFFFKDQIKLELMHLKNLLICFVIFILLVVLEKAYFLIFHNKKSGIALSINISYLTAWEMRLCKFHPC